MKFDPLVYQSPSPAMQRLSDCAIAGYTQYTSGTIQISDLPRMIDIMDGYYSVSMDRNERYRNKKEGRGCAKLILLQINDMEVVWWLLVTKREGKKYFHPAHRAENLIDALKPGNRINVNGYELVQLNLPSMNESGEKYYEVRFTWRMTAKKHQAWRNNLLDSIKQNWPDRKVRNLLHKLFASPGFAGNRQQIGHLVAFYRANWTRFRGNQPVVEPPSRLAYLRRIADTGISVNALVAMHRARNLLQSADSAD